MPARADAADFGATQVNAEQFIVLDNKFRNQFYPAWDQHVFQQLGVQAGDATMFKQTIGWTELICASMLLTSMRRVAAIILATVMVGACITHFWLNESLLMPAVLLVCNLLIATLNPAPEKLKLRTATATPKKGTKTPKKTPKKTD